MDSLLNRLKTSSIETTFDIGGMNSDEAQKKGESIIKSILKFRKFTLEEISYLFGQGIVWVKRDSSDSYKYPLRRTYRLVVAYGGSFPLVALGDTLGKDGDWRLSSSPVTSVNELEDVLIQAMAYVGIAADDSFDTILQSWRELRELYLKNPGDITAIISNEKLKSLIPLLIQGLNGKIEQWKLWDQGVIAEKRKYETRVIIARELLGIFQAAQGIGVASSPVTQLPNSFSLEQESAIIEDFLGKKIADAFVRNDFASLSTKEIGDAKEKCDRIKKAAVAGPNGEIYGNSKSWKLSDVLAALAEFKSRSSGTGASSPAATEAENRLGGIDFRTIPMLIQPMGGFS
ncbi:MAG: hypothetical protein WC394_02850, partial [Candidatus Omnitrophota bacterium]